MHQPHQHQFLLLPNFSHITLETFVKTKSSHLSKIMIFVFHPTNHQVTKSTQTTKVTKFAYAPTIPRSIPSGPQTSPTSLWSHFWRLSPATFPKSWFFVFHPTHHQVTKSSQNTKITKPGLQPTIPRSIPFAPKLFPHYFGGICEDWVHPFFKTIIFVFHPSHHQVKKSSQNTKITKLGLSPTIRRSIPCASKILPHHFGGICEVWV